MGRSYEIKEGRRVIIPTARQAEAMARKQAEANMIKDSKGRTGMTAKISDIAGLEEYIKSLGLSKKAQKDILDAAKVSDDFVQLNTLRILKALRDGDTKNEMEDKNSRFNLDALIKKWANSEVEMIAAWDKNNKFLGYNTIADKGKVYMVTTEGQLIGGTTIHSHPSEEGRFFGGSFSHGDWKTFRDNGERKMIVTSKEGTYILERDSNFKLSNSDINKVYVRTTVKTVLSTQKFTDPKPTKFGCTMAELAVWRDLHAGNKELAAMAGIKYTFIPNKGFSGIDK